MFLALLLTTALAVPYSTYTAILDPSPILYPTGWFSNIIDLSSNNAGQLVTITVNCNVPLTINTGTIVNLVVPWITATPTTYTYLLAANQLNVLDNTFTFTSVTLPSPTTPTAYGPISLFVYNPSASTGDLIASVLAYGSVVVVPAKTISSSILSLAYTATSVSLSSSASITFGFTLSVTLHANDYLTITIPSPFTGSSATIDFITNNSTNNNGNPYFMNALSVQSTATGATNIVTAYGLKAFNYTTSVTVSAILNGLTTPSYITTAASWSLEIFRFGTHTSLYQYTATGPGTGLVGGTIAISNWGPANGYVPYVYSGLTTYMNFTMSAPHAISAGSTITVTFSNLNINNAFLSDNTQASLTAGGGTASTVYAYAEPSIYFNLVLGNTSPISYTSPTSTLTLTVTTTIPAATKLIVTNLATFSSTSPTITSIITKDASNTFNVDSYSGSYAIGMYSTSYTVIATPTIQVWKDKVGTTLATLNPGSSQINAFVVSSLLMGSTTLICSGAGATNMTLSGPFSQDTTAQDTVFGFGATANNFIGIPNTTPTAGVTTTSYATIAAGAATSTTGVVFSANPRQFQFYAPAPTANTQYINFMIYSGSPAGTQQATYVPNFVSNIYTRYEICFQYSVYASASATAAISNYGYCKPLTLVTPTSTLTFDIVCGSTGRKGLTAILGITPFQVITALGTNSLSINFPIVSSDSSFSQSLMSGLTSGSVLPTGGFSTPANVNTAIWWSTATGSTLTTNINVTATNTPPSFAASAITFYFPFTALAASQTYTATASMYLVRQSDGAKFIVQTSTAGIVITGQTSSAFGSTQTTGLTTTGATVSSGGTISSLVITKTLTATAAGGLSIILPMGFTFSTPTISTNTPAAIFSSSNPSYGYPSLYYSASALSSPITLAGLVAPSWQPADVNIYIGTPAAAGAGNKASACSDLLVITLTITPPTITISSLSPATGTALTMAGSSSQTVILSCTAVVAGSVVGDSTSTITVTLSSAAPSGSTYTISGAAAFTGTFSGLSFTTSAITTSLISASNSFTISLTMTTPSTIGGFSSVSINYLGGYQYIVSGIVHSLSFTANSAVTVTSGISSVSVFPNTVSATGVHFQIVFTPLTAIPAGSSITISGENFASDASAQTNTWSNIGFTSSSITSSNLVLVTRIASASGSQIIIRKDLAYTNPSTAGNGAIWKITIVAPGSISIVSDTAVTTSTALNTINYLATPSATISSFSVATNTTNAGEAAYYKFSFKLSVSLLSNYSIVVDVPYYYDAIFGPTTTFTSNPNTYFLTTTSTVSSNPVCNVNHWLITCSLGVVLAANAAIDISILATNPPVPTATQTTNQVFSLYIVESSSTIKAISQSSSNTLTLTGIPTSYVDLYSVVVSSNQAVYSDYTFVFYSTETYLASGTVSVLFPAQYNFYRDQTISSISNACSGAYYTTTASGVTGTVLSSLTCTLASNNLATFTFSTAPTFSGTNEIDLTLKTILNPTLLSPSYTTSNAVLDTVTTAYITPYSFWTGKFTLYTTTSARSTSTAWNSRSYGNANAAFVGFITVNLKSLSVPIVYITPGTYSSYYTVTTDTGSLSATQLLLTPTSTGLTISPVSVTLYPSTPFALFKVGAPISTVSTIYYITWTIGETPLTANTNLYLTIFRSQVQVYATTGSIAITASTPSAVPNSGKSLPITLTYAPVFTYSDFTLSFTLSSNSTSITFTPSTLVYSNTVNTLAFQVVNPSNLTTITTYTIAVGITGTDAAAYSVPTISITVGGTVSGVTLSNLVFTAISPNILSVNVKSTGAANIYWIVSTTYAYSQNSNYSSLSYVQQYAYPITGVTTATTQSTLLSQYTAYNSSISSLGIGVTNYLLYSFSVLSQANSYNFIAMDSIPGASTSYSTMIYGLLGNTSYTITLWADNLSGNISNITGNAVTALAPTTILTLAFSDSPVGLSGAILSALASTTGQPVYLFSKISGVRRNLGTTAVVAIAPSLTNTKSTTSIATSVTNAGLTSTLSTLGVTTTGVIPTSRAATSTDFPSPAYSSSNFTLSTTKLLYFNYTAVGSGQIYYVVEYNPSYTYSISSSNVLVGQGRNGGIPYSSGSAAVTTSSSYLLFNFTTSYSGIYWISIELCNSIGACQSNSSLSVYNYNYNNGTSSSSSKNLLIALYALLALVI
jgi:hypothetical protein